MQRREISFVLILLLVHSRESLSDWVQKSDIISPSQVDSDSNLNDKNSAKVVGGNVEDSYQGAGGSSLIKGNSGTVKADQEGRGSSFDAIGPGGQKQDGTVNQGQKSANLLDSKGDKVVATGNDPNNVNAVVNNNNK